MRRRSGKKDMKNKYREEGTIVRILRQKGERGGGGESDLGMGDR